MLDSIKYKLDPIDENIDIVINISLINLNIYKRYINIEPSNHLNYLISDSFTNITSLFSYIS